MSLSDTVRRLRLSTVGSLTILLVIGAMLLFTGKLDKFKKETRKLSVNKKQQLLTSLILESETKKDCSHCQHQKYAEQISAIKAGK